MEKTIYPALKSTITIALVYFLLAKLSVQISSVTHYSQLLSLHSGFALAIMLTMTPTRALVGISLGALLSTFNIISFENAVSSLAISLIVPVILAVAQAYLGLKIYRRWVSLDNNLDRDDDLLYFLLVIPVIAVVCTLTSSLSMLWGVPVHDHDTTLLDWVEVWFGHTLGLILVIPVVLSLFGDNQPVWTSRRTILVSNFVASLAITYIVCNSINFFERDRLEDRFKVLTNQTATLFEVSLKEKELLQSAVAQLFVSSDEVTRAEFKAFVRGVSDQNDFIQVVEWLPKIELSQREAFEKEQRLYYGEQFSITQLKPNAKGVLIPATERDSYYPITYLEPELGNHMAEGFDPSGSQAANEVIDKAILTDKAQARGPVQIFRKTGFTHAFIVYKPVFKTSVHDESFEYRKAQLMGFVNTVVRVEDFIAAVVSAEQGANFSLQWQDVETGNYYFDSNVDERAPFQRVVDIQLSGRDMKLIFTPTPLFIEDMSTELVAIAMVTSFLLASLFSIVVLNITARTARITSEVKLRTQELEDANEKLEQLSNKDVLTNLYNRRYFEQALRDEFERAQRYNDAFALVIFDIDHFKDVNDKYGHPCGDQVLKTIANYLLSTSRSSDVVARIGGEEFAFILPEQTETQAQALVERIQMEINGLQVHYEELTIQFTCSFGIAICDSNVSSISELVRMADQAMYAAKEAGRNRIKLYSEL